MPTITWSNDKVETAHSWEALLDLVMSTGWVTFEDEDEFRTTMQKRAWRWSHTRISIDGDAADLFAEFERANLIVICDCKQYPAAGKTV